MRSSPGISAATTLGGVKNESPRFREFVAVNPGASVRLVSARLGIAELLGSGRLTAISASPPPGARPRFVALPALLTQPPPLSPKMPQLSGCPSYLKGSVPFALGTPSIDWLQRQRSIRSEEHTSELQSRLHLVCR